MSSVCEGRPTPRHPLPFGLMNLGQMINCNILALCGVGSELMLMECLGSYSFADSGDADDPIMPHLHDRAEKWLQIIDGLADDFEWDAVKHRIEIIRERLDGKRGDFTNRAFAMEMRVLRETIDRGLQEQWMFRYPSDKASILKRWTTDWAATIDKFPSSLRDIHAGVDLWAMGHSTASVFHFMRVLEHGLRALASDVEIKFDVQNWKNVIDEIEKKIRGLRETMPRGTDRNERLQFLSEAAKEFSYFKDGWRNYVSHNKATYDNHQARSVMEHVRAFMIALSSRLGDDAE